MRLPGKGRDDPLPPPPQSRDELVTPTSSLRSSIFGNNGVPSTLNNSMETERPHVSGETALESRNPSVAAEDRDGCSRIGTDGERCRAPQPQRPSWIKRRSPSVAGAENETATRCFRIATAIETAIERRNPSVAAKNDIGCSRIANDLKTAHESGGRSVAAENETGGGSRFATVVMETALESSCPSVPAKKKIGRYHVATDSIETTLERPNPSVAAEKKTWCSRADTDMEIAQDRPSPSVAARNGTGGRSHVETELRRPHSAATAASVLQLPRRIAHLGREKEFPVCHCHGVRGFKTSPARLQRRRGKTALDDGESTSRLGQIKNTATICLDGVDGKEVVPSYAAGITSILEWCRANGKVEDVSELFGPEVAAEVFTTPPGGTYYLVLEYSNRSLELVISGRDLYMMGWRGPNETYEIKSDSQLVNYMAGDDVRVVAARRNYRNISPDGGEVGQTKMGIHEFRRAFDDLFNYRGGNPRKVEEAIGKIAVYISEATRFQGAFDTMCASLKSDQVSRLNKGTFNHLWIRRYSHYCSEAMKHIDQRKRL